MKLFILGAMLFLVTAMGSKPPVKAPVELPPVEVKPVGSPMLIIGKCANCTPEELAFIRKAEGKTNEVVAGQCFQSKLGKMSLIQTNGKSSLQVAESLLGAGIRIDIEMYYTLKRVLGYTLPSAKMEWINRRYMLSWSVCDLGSLLAHETSHKVGYDHDYKPTSRRPQSVPYSINRAFESCCK